jgi:hypothetical protein
MSWAGSGLAGFFLSTWIFLILARIALILVEIEPVNMKKTFLL